MNRPILTLSTKDFLTGLAPSAHTERGGLFHVMNGVTAAYDPGGSASVETGLLQAVPDVSDISNGVVVDDIFAGTTGYESTTPYLFMLGQGGHFYRCGLNANPTDLRSATPITNPANGMFVYQPRGGTKYLYYMQKTQVGRYAMDGATFVDNHDTGWTSTALHPVHRFLDVVYIANTSKLGTLRDNGAGGVTFSKNDLDIPDNMYISAICNDGFNVVIAATENINATDNFSDTRIFFWDGFSSSWQREYQISERFIWAIKNIGSTVYAFGQYGVYELGFNAVPRKILSRNIGFANASSFNLGYGSNKVGLYNQNSIMFSAPATLDTIGRLAENLPYAYMRPALFTQGEATFIETQFQAGAVFVATENSFLFRINLASTSRQSGSTIHADTVYIPLNTQYNIKNVRLIFGEPLSSGDSIEIDLQSDNDTAEKVWNTWSFATDGAIRQKMKPAALGVTMTTDNLMVKFRFTGGAVKVKKIEIYGDPITN